MSRKEFLMNIQRRRVLARLGLGPTEAYAAPLLLTLKTATASTVSASAR